MYVKGPYKSKHPYQDINQIIYCKCGCGQQLKLNLRHRSKIPEYIQGHHGKGKIGPTKGMKFTRNLEWRKNHSEKLKGRKLSEEHKKNISLGSYNKGKSKYPLLDLNQVSYCQCGCGNKIILKEQHRCNRVPKYLKGHNLKNKKEEWLVNKKFKDTKIEIILQQVLNNENIKFETHKPFYIDGILTYPDIFIEPNICIFADGDYWHANPIKYEANNKIVQRKLLVKEIWEHDRKITEALENNGYKVLRFWESEITKNLEGCLQKLWCSNSNLPRTAI